MACPGGVGVIFCGCTVGDHENLHILIQSAACPKAVALIAVNLVERLFDCNAAPLQLHMDKGQTVYQNRHIIPCIVVPGGFYILIDDLQMVVVDVLLVDQGNIQGCVVLTDQVLHIVLLDFPGFFHDALIGVGNLAFEKAVPFLIRKLVVVQQLYLLTEIGNERVSVMDGHILIALFTEHFDKRRFQSRFALIGITSLGMRRVFGHDHAFVGGKHDIVGTHGNLLFCYLSAGEKASSLSR